MKGISVISGVLGKPAGKCPRTAVGMLAVLLVLLAVSQVLPAAPAPAQPKIPPGSKIYIHPMDGFESYLAAGLAKKKVPVVVVPDRATADYEITGTFESEKEEGTKGWQKVAEIGLTGWHRGSSVTVRASWSVKNVRSGDLAFAYSVVKRKSGAQQSAAEAFAKNLKNAMTAK